MAKFGDLRKQVRRTISEKADRKDNFQDRLQKTWNQEKPKKELRIFEDEFEALSVAFSTGVVIIKKLAQNVPAEKWFFKTTAALFEYVEWFQNLSRQSTFLESWPERAATSFLGYSEFTGRGAHSTIYSFALEMFNMMGAGRPEYDSATIDPINRRARGWVNAAVKSMRERMAPILERNEVFDIDAASMRLTMDFQADYHEVRRTFLSQLKERETPLSKSDIVAEAMRLGMEYQTGGGLHKNSRMTRLLRSIDALADGQLKNIRTALETCMDAGNKLDASLIFESDRSAAIKNYTLAGENLRRCAESLVVEKVADDEEDYKLAAWFTDLTRMPTVNLRMAAKDGRLPKRGEGRKSRYHVPTAKILWPACFEGLA